MDTQTITASAKLCLEDFESCISRTKETKEEDEVDIADFLDTECGRFRIWAKNIGVFAAGHASLDYRLRDSSYVKELLLGQLYIVHKHLTRGKIIAQNTIHQMKDSHEQNTSETLILSRYRMTAAVTTGSMMRR